jgi:hypothetical protein
LKCEPATLKVRGSSKTAWTMELTTRMTIISFAWWEAAVGVARRTGSSRSRGLDQLILFRPRNHLRG